MAKEESALGITKFDGSNYAYWRMQIKDFLFSKKLHLPLGSKLEGMKTEDWNLLKRHILGVIFLMLSKNVAHNVPKEKTTIGMM